MNQRLTGLAVAVHRTMACVLCEFEVGPEGRRGEEGEISQDLTHIPGLCLRNLNSWEFGFFAPCEAARTAPWEGL